MGINSRCFLIVCFLLLQILTSTAQTCSNNTFSRKQIFNSCKDLPTLQSHLHWNYIQSARSIQMAYRATQKSTGWIANPTGKGMAGSQAIVAFHNHNGNLTVYPTPINSYNPSMQPGSLSFQVSTVSAEYANGEMIIFAVIGPLENGTTVNHVWQAGNTVSNDIPQIHPPSGPNIQSMGTVDFMSA